MNRWIAALEGKWLQAVAILVSLTSFVIFGVVGFKYTQYTGCVAEWANATTARNKVVGDASAARLNALHKLLLDAIVRSPGTNTDLQKFLAAVIVGDVSAEISAAKQYITDTTNANSQLLLKDISDFVTTEESYQSTLKTHPLPPAPKLNC